jgi:hypothetical protein
MYHLVYLTTNLVNNKIYVGVHSTYNLEDGYLGKGIAIKKSIIKYGRKMFKRQILHFCLTREDAFKLETQIVDINFVLRKDTYNLTIGGVNPYDHKSHPNREKFKHIYSENAKKGYASMSTDKKQIMFQRRKETLAQEHIQLLHKNNTKIGMANMSDKDKELMRTNMKGNNNNKKKWLLSNTLGQQYIIEDLKTFCKENGFSYGYMFYTLRKLKKPKFWNLQQID